MNVLVVGGGGREHALVWKIAQSPKVEKVYCAPGNAGIEQIAECVPIGVNDLDALAVFAHAHRVDLTVVGPEEPLSRGIADRFRKEGLRVFGPSQQAARLESSKAFAKRIMSRYGIPTARYAEFSHPDGAAAYVREHGAPIVIKADGLAAGKGVTVARTVEEALAAIDAAMVKKAFGEAGAQIVVEEFLVGEEASILAFTDGTTVLPMEASQDHKAVFDGDAGPNTGGMGAYSPAPVVSDSLFEEVTRTILEPCVRGMAAEGSPYTGCLYAGIMVTESGPKVVEFNCRFGDPETQVVLPRMKTDVVLPLEACCTGTLHDVRLEWLDVACVTVVMASGGYPGPYEKGKPIAGIEQAEADGRAVVFHAGTRRADKRLVTDGGRVLNVTATGPDIPSAIRNAYSAVRRVHFDGAHYRTDIGRKAIRHLT